MKITLLDSFLSQFGRNEEWMVFLYLATKADKMGKLVVSQNEICNALNLSRQVVRMVLENLVNNQLINQQTTNRATYITINKSIGYTLYISTQEPTNNQRNNQQKSQEEITFDNWMKDKYPRVHKMDVPLTYYDMQDILSSICPDRNEIIKKLDAMENWKLLLQKRRYAKKTLLQFLKNDYD